MVCIRKHMIISFLSDSYIEDRAHPVGSRERANIPIVVAHPSGYIALRYGDTKPGKAESEDSEDRQESRQPRENIVQPPRPQRPSTVVEPTPPAATSQPPSVPLATRPILSQIQEIAQPPIPPRSRAQELEAEIQELYVLLAQEKQKPAPEVPDFFDHYELIPPDGSSKGAPNELYQLPEVCLVRRPRPVEPRRPSVETQPPTRPTVTLDTTAYRRALNGPYRGELAGGSKSKPLVRMHPTTPRTNTPVTPRSFYTPAGAPPSARPLNRQIPPNHPSVRVVPGEGELTRATQQRRLSRQVPSRNNQPLPAQPPLRFDRQRYLRDNTSGPSCEVFLEEPEQEGSDAEME